MSATTASQKTAASSPSRLWSLLCFALLGGLGARPGGDGLAAGLGALAGLITGWLFLVVMGRGLALFFRSVGFKGVKTAVSRGFLLLIPFTVLGLVAEWVLGWTAANAFASAGVMASSAAVGLELAQAGGGKWRSTLLPVLAGMAVTTLWMMANAALQGLFIRML